MLLAWCLWVTAHYYSTSLAEKWGSVSDDPSASCWNNGEIFTFKEDEGVRVTSDKTDGLSGFSLQIERLPKKYRKIGRNWNSLAGASVCYERSCSNAFLGPTPGSTKFNGSLEIHFGCDQADGYEGNNSISVMNWHPLLVLFSALLNEAPSFLKSVSKLSLWRCSAGIQLQFAEHIKEMRRKGTVLKFAGCCWTCLSPPTLLQLVYTGIEGGQSDNLCIAASPASGIRQQQPAE